MIVYPLLPICSLQRYKRKLIPIESEQDAQPKKKKKKCSPHWLAIEAGRIRLITHKLAIPIGQKH